MFLISALAARAAVLTMIGSIAGLDAAAGIFTLLRDESVIRARHVASGFVCSFISNDSSRNRIVLLSSVRGDDVDCKTDLVDAQSDTFITRYSPDSSIETVFADSIEAMKKKQPSAEVLDLDWFSMPANASDPKVKLARFRYNDDQGDHYTRIAVARLGVWTILSGSPARSNLASRKTSSRRSR